MRTDMDLLPLVHSTKAMLNLLSRRKFNIEYLVVQRYFQQPTVKRGLIFRRIKVSKKLIAWCVFANGKECMTPMHKEKQNWQAVGKKRKPKTK